MDNYACKVDYQILFLSLGFAIIFSLLMNDTRNRNQAEIENFNSIRGSYTTPYQNPPKKTSFSRLYFPGILPGMKSRKTLPPMRYASSYQNPNMKLVKVIQDNAR